MSKYRLLIANAILLAALAGSAWGRRVENAEVSRTDFLRPLVLPFRGWKTSDAALSPSDLQLLKPDATLVRRYAGPDGQEAELAVIAGHRKSSVHTPGFCMVGGGWEITSQQVHTVALPGRTVEAVRATMVSEGHQILATYFFTDGEDSTSSLVRFQGTQLLKRFRSQVPVGALVRIIVPVRTSVEDAGKLSDEFAAATVPPVLATLRSVHLETR